ncbi:MAG: type II toxin-antitoxin system HicA family toxin [Candidatus Wallbacteria bacterium]|nr:type II toxin-antitoxin system HicA family toxin [Candidatus Wallbacteria bacterium]
MPKITTVSYKILVKVFKTFGFAVSRTTGDHIVMTCPDCPRPLVIPKWDAVPGFIIRNNLRTAGITRDKYLEALKSI